MYTVALLLTAHLAVATPPVPVVGGEPTSAFPAVGALVVCEGDGCASFCSGTLVSGRWVLTAAHCVEAATHTYAGRDVEFAFGEDVRSGATRTGLVPVSEGLVHPRYDGDLDHDIGLVKLADEAASVQGLPVVASAPTEAWLDHPLRYVGYGVSGDEATDAGIKRRADIPLEGWDDQWLFARDPEGEANLCWGDSGGAALLPMGDGSFVLAGVQSWIWDDDDTPCAGGQSGAARVDAHLSWIEEHASPVTVTLEEEEEAEPDPEGEDTSAPDLDGSGDTGSGPSPGDAPDGDRSLLPADESTAEPDESTHLGGFGPAPAGCRHVPAPGAPWLPALVAALATLGLGRRRRA